METWRNMLSIIYYFEFSHLWLFQEFYIEVFCQDTRNHCDLINLISIVLLPKNSNMQERWATNIKDLKLLFRFAWSSLRIFYFVIATLGLS